MRRDNLAGATGGGAVFAEVSSNATFTNCVAINNTNYAPAKARARTRGREAAAMGTRLRLRSLRV